MYNAGNGKLILKDMLKRPVQDVEKQIELFVKQLAATDKTFGTHCVRPEASQCRHNAAI